MQMGPTLIFVDVQESNWDLKLYRTLLQAGSDAATKHADTTFSINDDDQITKRYWRVFTEGQLPELGFTSCASPSRATSGCGTRFKATPPLLPPPVGLPLPVAPARVPHRGTCIPSALGALAP